MNTSQLECYIKCDSVLNEDVLGVYASNRLPRQRINQASGLIVNTDVYSQPGQHWCAIYNDGKGRIEFFDSYGRPPERNSHHIKSWIHERANSCSFNRKQLQSNHSSVCGFYCILYLHQRLRGISLDDFVETFDSSNLEANDDYVMDVITSAFPECLSEEDLYNQFCVPYFKCTE